MVDKKRTWEEHTTPSVCGEGGCETHIMEVLKIENFERNCE